MDGLCLCELSSGRMNRVVSILVEAFCLIVDMMDMEVMQDNKPIDIKA